MSPTKTAEPIKIPFGLWSWTAVWDANSCGLKEARVGGAHWLNLANTIEPSVCGGDAALCQITLTSCYRLCTKNTVLSLSIVCRGVCKIVEGVSG